jgi:hypothetical protein
MTFRKYGEKSTEGLSGRGGDGTGKGKYRMRVDIFFLVRTNDMGSYG